MENSIPKHSDFNEELEKDDLEDKGALLEEMRTILFPTPDLLKGPPTRNLIPRVKTLKQKTSNQEHLPFLVGEAKKQEFIRTFAESTKQNVADPLVAK